MFMPAPSISTVTKAARDIPTLTIYEDFDKIIAKEVCFTETGQHAFDPLISESNLAAQSFVSRLFLF